MRRVIAGVALCTAPLAGYSALRPDEFDNYTYAARIRWQAIGRFCRSLMVGANIVADYKLVFFNFRHQYESSEYEAELKACHKRSAERILNGCLHNGGLYIKLGQGLVTMAHILPREYIEALEILENQALRREKHEVAKIFSEDLNCDPSEVFEEFRAEPIAAASLAQVYYAKLNRELLDEEMNAKTVAEGAGGNLRRKFTDGTDTSRQVAVKIQYRDLRDRFPYDIWTLEKLMRLVEFVHPHFGFAWVLERLKNTLVRELDFVNEAHNSERCARDLGHLDYIYVPRVFWKLTSKRILTMEYIDDAVKITQIDDLRKRKYDLADICTKLNECFAHQLFGTGFVHADPHPGNVLVRRNAKSNEAQLVLLDHGLYEYLEPEKRNKLCKLYAAIITNDQPGMQRFSNALGVENWQLFSEVLVQRPIHRRVGWRLPTRMMASDYEHMRKMAQERFDEIMQVLRQMPINMVLIIRNMNTVRAISRRLGNPVDRYIIMARCAIRGALQPQEDSVESQLQGLGQKRKIVTIFHRFDSKLRMQLTLLSFRLRVTFDRLSTFITVSFLRLLSLIGRAPPNAYTDLLQIAKQTEDAAFKLV